MSFVKSNDLENYDIYPKVFQADSEQEITIRPLGAHAAFGEDAYTVLLCPLSEGTPWDYPHTNGWVEYEDCKPCADGTLRFRHHFCGEQEHSVRVRGERGDLILKLSVYSVAQDLCGRYPFAGDLHMHSFRSDGKQAPAIVAANYRRIGYDFLAITDHHRYYPSLEAMDAYRGLPIEYTLLPGEEVHMPKGDRDHINDVHIVNFGGEYSVNALLETSANNRETGGALEKRSLNGKAPDIISKEQYFAAVDKLLEVLTVPAGVEPFAYASCVWVFQKIREAGGLGIYAHPYWISDVIQVPERLNEYLFETQPFDAFEVLGGENYFEQNGYQTICYYEQLAKGRRIPIVGSTDSHSSVNNRNGAICSTIVFAPQNERTALIQAIKDCYSVAVDTISAEFRMVGELRLVKYATFLYKNFFPLHDELCFEEGRAMRDYACGDPNAEKILRTLSGRMQAQREKYFRFA